VCGLTAAEIAHAILTSEATIAKRIPHAKQKIALTPLDGTQLKVCSCGRGPLCLEFLATPTGKSVPRMPDAYMASLAPSRRHADACDRERGGSRAAAHRGDHARLTILGERAACRCDHGDACVPLRSRRPPDDESGCGNQRAPYAGPERDRA
jgi:hypothetical protein